ncbi:hypothetical protein SRHO_G00312550 [Serrasalmus rhombeus]
MTDLTVIQETGQSQLSVTFWSNFKIRLLERPCCCCYCPSLGLPAVAATQVILHLPANFLPVEPAPDYPSGACCRPLRLHPALLHRCSRPVLVGAAVSLGLEAEDFMDTEGGESLYRATVGLIWYFSWCNVSKGKTKVKSIIYHVCMGADMVLLLVLWFWKRSVESARLSPLPVNPYILIGGLPVLYITGLLLKLLYYWKFHPNCPSLRFGDGDETPSVELCRVGAGANVLVETDSADIGRRNEADKRMRNMAANFYY